MVTKYGFVKLVYSFYKSVSFCKGSEVFRANDFPFKKNAFSVSHLVNSVFFSVSAHFVHPEVD